MTTANALSEIDSLFGAIELEAPFYEDSSVAAQLPVHDDAEAEQAIFLNTVEEQSSVIRRSHIEEAIEEGSFDAMAEKGIEGRIEDGSLIVNTEVADDIVVEEPEALLDALEDVQSVTA